MDIVEQSKIMLNRWLNYSVQELYAIPERPDLLCYGSGYNGWGMQTHQKGFAAFAVAAVTRDFSTDIPKAELLDYSLKMLRYMLESHIEGSFCCVEGDKWGHTWISVLGVERAMHAVDLLRPCMTKEDAALLRKVLISEADWLLEKHPAEACVYAESNRNHPESNLWNGAFLHRVSQMYQDCPNNAAYRKKASVFLINSISVSQDKNDMRPCDGERVCDLHIGSNFFDSYALDHHGYLNVGYMVITLSNAAMYHFACKMNHFTPPEALYHHVKELWRLVKSFLFPDGRLIRIGGDTRVRYCYCQDYALPMLLFARDYLGDGDALEMQRGIVELYRTEMESNGDGSFLSDRCAGFREISPIYYTRLESDRAVVLSMLACWKKYVQEGREEIPVYPAWREAYHGACMVRGNNRFASWAVSGGTGPMGLCLPYGRSDLAEWDHNLTGDIRGTGAFAFCQCDRHEETLFAGGFTAFGGFRLRSEYFLAEQQKPETTAVLQVAYAVLPDDGTAVVMQYALCPERIYIRSVMGLMYNVPNDIFNHKTRRYYYNGAYHDLKGITGKEEVLETASDYVNIDGVLGIYGGYGKAFSIYRPGTRKTGILVHANQDKLHEQSTYSFYTDTVARTVQAAPRWRGKGEVLLDEGAVISVGVDAEQTKALAGFCPKIKVEHTALCRSVVAKGQDGRLYVAVANFGSKAAEVKTSGGRLEKVADKAPFDGSIGGNSVLLLRETKS